MKHLFTLLLVVAFVFTSCDSDSEKGSQTPETADQTVLMYLPWSNLSTYFSQNIEDLKTAISEGIIKNERVLVFYCSSPTKATLSEITYKKGKVTSTVLNTYTFDSTTPEYTTTEGITSILNDVKGFAPAERYAMTIGCHGLGWIPSTSSFSRSTTGLIPHWEYSDTAVTRWFGVSPYKTDVTTLANAIIAANIRMDYILFDDCYMSNIEVAYDLKDVTDYLIACPTEILVEGMPYAKIGKYLIGTVNPEKICEEFYSFYSNTGGTIGVIDCRNIDRLASIMREINEYTFDPSNVSAIQKLDGYSPTIFFDFGDYVDHIDITDLDLLQSFKEQLALVVPYKAHTGRYPAAIPGGGLSYHTINAYSGITISDPTTNSKIIDDHTQTAWYQATHE